MIATDQEDKFNFKLYCATINDIEEYITNPDFCIKESSDKKEIDSKEFIMENIDEYVDHSYSIMVEDELIGMFLLRPIEDNILEFQVNIKPNYRKRSFLKELMYKLDLTDYGLLNSIATKYKIVTTATRDSYIATLLSTLGFKETIKSNNGKSLFEYSK